MCGSAVDETATECSGCGEQFAPVEEVSEEPEFYEEITTEETEEVERLTPEEEITDEIQPEDIEAEEVITDEIQPEDIEAEEVITDEIQPEDLDADEELLITDETEEEIPEEEVEPPEEELQVSEEGCPICGSKLFSVESGDLVSCDDCGNVYIRKEYVGPCKQNWKLKFWVGLIFIIVGDIGVALGSYVHNIYRWSPLGDLYLGYGWMDQAFGVVGIVLFIVGLILFAWSFKREREVQCPSCKVIICEDQMAIHEEKEEEEEDVPEEEAIETAMEEIGEVGECPHCGVVVSLFDTVCPNCETPLDLGEEQEETAEEIVEDETQVDETEAEIEAEMEPTEYVPASELDETEMILESLELLEEEATEKEPKVEEPEEDEDGMRALRELEEEFEGTPLETEIGTTEMECSGCGMLIDKGLSSCPICGADTPSGE
jgi:hypothetical protein